MTKEELIQKKHQMDAKIAVILKEFSNETGFSVSYIRVEAIETSNKCDSYNRSFVHSVNCQVDI